MTCTEPLLDLSIVVNKMQEHHTVLNRRVDHLEQGLNDTNGTLRIIDEKLNVLTSWTNRWSSHVDRRLDAHDQRFDSIDERFVSIDQQLGEIRELLVDALKRRN